MITVNDMSFRYRGRRKPVLDKISFDLKPNNICGLLGKNGVGKSTLLYLLSGMLQPDSGSVKICGMESKDGDPSMLEDLFFVTEEFAMPDMRLTEYKKITAPFYPRFSDELFYDCLKEFEIEGDVNLTQLSMGQKKKVLISFAIAANTKILLMDEPTNGLDIPSKAQFRKVVSKGMTEERIIIISTHQIHDVAQLLDHVIILSNEGVLMNKSTQDICNDYVFECRMPSEMDDALYAEPSLKGNEVIAPRNGRPETPINMELLFNYITQNK